MPFTSRSLLVSFAGCLLYGAPVIADDGNPVSPENSAIFPLKTDAVNSCKVPDKMSKEEEEQQPVLIQADSVEASNNSKAVYKGNVHIIKGRQEIKADSITLHQQENIAIAEGNVDYSSMDMRSTSDKVTTDLTTEDTTMVNTAYKMSCQPIRGTASRVLKTGQEIYQLEDASFTTCPADDNSWRFKASDIELDQSDEWATFYNARFEVLDVPIFYLPYITVPVGDQRKTGVLIPSIGLDSKNGFELSVPIYWNIAPNYDATTTVNYMEKRGTQLEAEFRYLETFGQGTVDLEYLNEDAKFKDKGARWGVSWNHSGIYQQNWKFEVDYSKVSDIDYFQDLNSSIGTRDEGQLSQSGEVSYRTQDWDMTMRVRDFQVLVDEQTPYRLMPQIEFNYYAPQFYKELDFNLHSHVSKFATDDETKPSATRVHLEPKLSLPLSSTWWSLTPEASLLYTYYSQEFDQSETSLSGLSEEVSRTIPEVRINGAIYLDSTHKFLGEYLQTLEPKIQYLYVPEVDQSEIYGGRGEGGYDSSKLQLDYYGLFRDRQYSGVDYISSANQFSIGATSRFYDDAYKERMNISFGQILYMDGSGTTNENDTSNSSAWAMESDFNFNDYLFYHGGIQYDSNISELQVANSTLEYRFAKGYVQANYRYVSKNYIESNVRFEDDSIEQITQHGIYQAGLLSEYNLGRNWALKGQYFHDTKEDQMIEALVGVTYLSDCWSFGLTYSDQLIAPTNDSALAIGSYEPEYESNLMLSISIRGLGSNTGITSGSATNALGYGRPFYLNN
ncbi:LPS assembly protein LptD [Aliivibrio sp. S4TY2]|uniref:LPS assembly protein LptD n=1 Tax=unclassified Aliivibrio TaxID=2645654 RepID=UPI0023784246|nr:MULTISPECIES: LPS assembly protein LptD [unclassified Aliivibrio]MDD9157670.1 LPS assembly protein LptD [Aliivibrio sp. S4TY2]MDD9161652.1 LPS assembly protein LptD [Aliivibrio sp. S4TY1]MDD9165671.1 LPS assembly protein LptD [Aliivibrio sp. S4MY2]MDD9169670.1 LPS assembly protein LptD [Aliivibrio sp. S4MY4]MDD9186674.1 LPS assembly protein LptD [Aliivibrio sp. S4MY3]